MFDFIEAVIKAPLICCGWIIVGFLAGGIARYVMKSEDKPFFNDIILGLAGAAIGFFITGTLLKIDTDTSGLASWLVTFVIAVFGAMILIFVGRKIFGGADLSKSARRRRKKRR